MLSCRKDNMIKIRNILLKIILVISTIAFGGIFLICVSDAVVATAFRKVLYGAAAAFVMGGTYFLFRRLERYLQKIPEKMVYLWVFFLFVALTIVSFIVRNAPTADYEEIYKAVLALLDGEPVSWEYFSRWPNNYALLWLLYLGGAISRFIGIQDIFYVLATLNALATSLSVLCVYKIIEYYEPQKKYLQYTGAALMALFIPIWAGTQYVYSDSASILYGVAAICCLINGKKGKKYWFVLAGISLSIGLLLKPTTCICVIAFLIMEIMNSYTKGSWKWYAVMFGTAALLCGVFSNIKENAPYHVHDAEYKAPFEFWFALGLLEDGSFSTNLPFAMECLTADTYEERKEIAVQTIKDEYDALFDWQHIKAKTRCNFESGTFGMYLFQYNVGFGYMLFNPFGLYGSHFSLFSTVYFWLLLLIAFISCIIMFFDKKKNTALLTWMLGFCGIVMFIMLWEANNRQLYNQMPLFALLGAFCMDYIVTKIKEFKVKKEEIHG